MIYHDRYFDPYRHNDRFYEHEGQSPLPPAQPFSRKPPALAKRSPVCAFRDAFSKTRRPPAPLAQYRLSYRERRSWRRPRPVASVSRRDCARNDPAGTALRNGPVAQGSSGPRTRPACALAHRQRTQGSGLLMAAVVKRLAVFAYLDDDWAPAGLLEMTEEGVSLQASSFAYGLRYLGRPNAIEVDPVSLSLARKDEIRGKMNFPAGGLTQFGGIRDAAPDAWGDVSSKPSSGPKPTRCPSPPISCTPAVSGSAHSMFGKAWTRPRPAGGQWPAQPRIPGRFGGAHRGRRDRARRTRGHLRTRSGLGGARPKATVRDEDGVLWLAKFPSLSDRLNLTVIEEATLRLAARCGIRVPPTRIVDVGTRQVMLIRRFDRYWTHPEFDTLRGDDALYLPLAPERPSEDSPSPVR